MSRDGAIASHSIELISPEIIRTNASISGALDRMNRTLALSSGWHYLLDWTWTVQRLGDAAGLTILDAGAGIGLLQWYLASVGARVLSVDRDDRTCIPFHLLDRFGVSGYRPADTPLARRDLLLGRSGTASPSRRVRALLRGVAGEFRCRLAGMGVARGPVELLRAELADLAEIPTASVDAVVSVSAIEHNHSLEAIRNVARELRRVIRPGGKLLVTTSAARDSDWYFAAPRQWNMTEATLRHMFDLPDDTPSNFEGYDDILGRLKGSKDLRRRMSWRYRIRGDTGMPWGVWNPRYVPVGISITVP